MSYRAIGAFRAQQQKPLEMIYPGDHVCKAAGLMVFGPDETGQLLELKLWFRELLTEARLRDCMKHFEVYPVLVFTDSSIEGMRFSEPAAFMFDAAGAGTGIPDYIGPLVINWIDKPNLRL
jgi:hypothetical protein